MHKLRFLPLLILLANGFLSRAQDSLPNSYLFFPHPMTRRWHQSIGFTFTDLPRDVTEEVQLRAPVIDLHVLRRLSKHWILDGRVKAQVLQNHFSAGPRYTRAINDRFSFSVGDDFAWWFGILMVSDFRTKANGFINYPNASVGMKLKKDLLLTLKGEGLITLTENYTVGGRNIEKANFSWDGYSLGLFLEQPFYKRTSVTLGFKAQYTNFFWQTWPLFETFDRKIFYPEILIGFIR